MKRLILPILASFVGLSSFASSPDDAGHHEMLQYLHLLPDTLFFNQDYYLDGGTQSTKQLSVVMEDYSIEQRDHGAMIRVPWSNREEDKKLVQMYLGDGGQKSLVAEKRVVIIQKVKGDVSSDYNLFKMDEREISLRDNISQENWQKAQQLDINPARFNADGLHIASFKVTELSTGRSIDNAGSSISPETKAFLSNLGSGSEVRITHIKAAYSPKGQPVTI
ncbi:MAG: hypothetical protein JST83_05975, partial [Bacteroidetes bacterium]|nr:hypothetical protein [Bacteroidota bacterium]